MATFYLKMGRDIPHFDLNSLIFIYFPLVKFFHTLPHHGNDGHFELARRQGCNESFFKIIIVDYCSSDRF